jgi:flagellar assembly protein FliH
MAAVRKFLFDTRFDAPPPPPPSPEPEENAEEEMEEEPAPTFSEEEMNAARQEGFDAGREEGIREAAEATERQIAETLAIIGQRMGAVFAAQQKTAEELQADSIAVIQALAHKVLPEMSAREGTGEIERLAREILDRLRTEPRIVFTVNDGLAERLQEQLPALAAGMGCSGTVEVIADSSVAPGDCRIDWTNGGAERDTARLIAEIDGIIERNGGPAPSAVAAQADTAEETKTAAAGLPEPEAPAPATIELPETPDSGAPEETDKDLVIGEIDG